MKLKEMFADIPESEKPYVLCHILYAFSIFMRETYADRDLGCEDLLKKSEAAIQILHQISQQALKKMKETKNIYPDDSLMDIIKSYSVSGGIEDELSSAMNMALREYFPLASDE